MKIKKMIRDEIVEIEIVFITVCGVAFVKIHYCEYYVLVALFVVYCVRNPKIMAFE